MDKAGVLRPLGDDEELPEGSVSVTATEAAILDAVPPAQRMATLEMWRRSLAAADPDLVRDLAMALRQYPADQRPSLIYRLRHGTARVVAGQPEQGVVDAATGLTIERAPRALLAPPRAAKGRAPTRRPRSCMPKGLRR